MMSAVARYVLHHWRGEHSLVWSFWVSFVALGAVSYLVQTVTPLLLSEAEVLFYVTLAEFVVFRLLLYPWQAIGVLRACEKDEARFYWVRAAQGVVLLGIVWVAVDGLGVLHVRNVAIDLAERQRHLSEVQQRNYTFQLSADATAVYLRGPLDPGVTRDLREYLAVRAGVVALVLNSSGGNIYEGRGLARLIRESGLDTYTTTVCTSACATAFIGGHRRWLADGARLGLHQYQLQSRHAIPGIEPNNELLQDFAEFSRQGVDIELLQPALATAPDSMWYPNTALLQAAGVIHGTARPPAM